MNNTLKKEFKDHYDIANVTVNVRHLRSTDNNDVYLVGFEEGIKSVLRISTGLSDQDALFELDAIDYFIKKGIRTPGYIKTKDNKGYFRTSGDKIAILFNFQEGKNPTFDEIKNTNLAEQAGEFLAKMHKQMPPFKTEYFKKRDITSEIKSLLLKSDYIEKNFIDGLEFISQVRFGLDFINEELNDITEILLQNDYRPQNLMIVQGKIRAIIDFDWCCMGPAIWELSLAVLEWSYPDGKSELNLDIAGQFLQGYNRIARSGHTLESLNRWIKVVALDGACTYVLGLIAKKKTGEVRSYMYSKYKYFNNIGKS